MVPRPDPGWSELCSGRGRDGRRAGALIDRPVQQGGDQPTRDIGADRDQKQAEALPRAVGNQAHQRTEREPTAAPNQTGFVMNQDFRSKRI